MTDKVWGNEDREFFETRFREIAERLTNKGFIPSNRRKGFRVDMEDGRVFKFTITGFLKIGSKSDIELKAELEGLKKQLGELDVII